MKREGSGVTSVNSISIYDKGIVNFTNIDNGWGYLIIVVSFTKRPYVKVEGVFLLLNPAKFI